MLKIRIASAKREYTKVERLLSEYILDNYNKKTADMNITQLSRKLNISPSAITRFCQKLKLRGFKEFQNEMFSDIHQMNNYQEARSPFMLNEIIESIKKTEKILDEQELLLVVSKILERKNVFVYGEAFTHLMAQFFSRKLNKINIPSTHFNVASDGGIIMPKNNSVHIFISTSGQNKNIKRAAKKIMAGNVKNQMLVSVTASRFSNISECENAHLHGAFMNIDGTNPYELPSITFHVLQYILDIIYEHIYAKDKFINDKIINLLADQQNKK